MRGFSTTWEQRGTQKEKQEREKRSAKGQVDVSTPFPRGENYSIRGTEGAVKGGEQPTPSSNIRATQNRREKKKRTATKKA